MFNSNVYFSTDANDYFSEPNLLSFHSRNFVIVDTIVGINHSIYVSPYQTNIHIHFSSPYFSSISLFVCTSNILPVTRNPYNIRLIIASKRYSYQTLVIKYDFYMLECSNKKHLKNATRNMQNSAYIWINNYSIVSLNWLYFFKAKLCYLMKHISQIMAILEKIVSIFGRN